MIAKKLPLLIILLISLFGCNADLIREFVSTPQIKGIELKSFSAQNNSAVFEVALYNPNAFALPLSGLAGDIRLNQLPIGNINAKSDKNLPALTTQKITLPIMLDSNALIKAAKSVLTQRQAEYNFNGHVKTSIGEVPFSKHGALSVKDLISILFR